jgi:hypothetical protein
VSTWAFGDLDCRQFVVLTAIEAVDLGFRRFDPWQFGLSLVCGVVGNLVPSDLGLRTGVVAGSVATDSLLV